MYLYLLIVNYMTDRLDVGLKELIDKAIELDKKGLKKEACQYYLKASGILIKMANGASLKSVRTFYIKRAQECVDRVRYLMGKTGRADLPQSSSGMTSITPAKPTTRPERYGREENTEVDEETKRLQEMIADTIITERPNVKMSEVADLVEAKQAISEAILAPLRYPALFRGKARQPWRAILFYGPAGCGKTLIAKAVASEFNATFFNVSAGNIVSKWLGESEKLVMKLFELARRNQPAVIFIDELDSVGISRSGDEVGGERRLKTQLLTEIQGLSTSQSDKVTVIGATNVPWELDVALKSRFEKRIYIPLPDHEARREIFEIHMEDIEVGPDVDYLELADLTEGYSGRDISIVCREAAMEPIRELQQHDRGETDETLLDIRPVEREDFLHAIEMIKPATPPEMIRRYVEWASSA